MRWKQHRMIGKDCFCNKPSLFFVIGCCAPDVLDFYRTHRAKETLDIFVKNSTKIRKMRNGFIKDYCIGVLSHYICDYCTQAHGEEYFRFFRHRVYEVQMQKYYLKNYNEFYNLPNNNPIIIPQILKVPGLNDELFVEKFRIFLEKYLLERNEKVKALESSKWYIDHRIMALDIYYSYCLLSAIMTIFREKK